MFWNEFIVAVEDPIHVLMVDVNIQLSSDECAGNLSFAFIALNVNIVGRYVQTSGACPKKWRPRCPLFLHMRFIICN